MKDSTTTLDILQDLIRLETQNPPGNEKVLVAYIKSYCDQLGVESTVFTYEGNRSNILIRMGIANGRNLVVLGHTDVVTAEPDLWTYDPFAAEIHDGYLYGRGALDMKYFIATALSVMKTLKQNEANLKRQVIFLFTADEETGSSYGLPRVLQEPGIAEDIANSFVLNEGGGFSVFNQQACHYLYETGQKSVCAIRVTIPESPDTNPYFPDLRHEKLVFEVIKRLEAMDLDESIPDTIRALQMVFPEQDPATERLIATMSSSMVTATVVKGGSRNPDLPIGVKATIDFDCRLLPHISRSYFEDKVSNALDGLPVSVEILRYSQGYEAQVGDNLVGLLEQVLKRHDPDILSLLPFITPGSNDGKYLLPLGCDVIGFAPLAKEQSFPEIMPLIHGIDERISLDSIAFCTNVITDVCVEYLTGDV
ncbi:MAG: M20/M25/M40 family metallo-hydrolase [Sphaerochaetaceae bacterium]